MVDVAVENIKNKIKNNMSYILKRTKTKLFPEGIYSAIVKDLKTGPSKFDEDKESITLVFQTDYREFKGEAGRKIMRSYTSSLYEKSKLSSVIEALLGRKIGEEEEIDIYSLIGKECRLKIENRKGEVSGKIASRIMEVLPATEEIVNDIYDDTPRPTIKDVPF